MEYTLEAARTKKESVLADDCLNPCFGGIYSRRLKFSRLYSLALGVLILVLVEYTLEVITLANEYR